MQICARESLDESEHKNDIINMIADLNIMDSYVLAQPNEKIGEPR